MRNKHSHCSVYLLESQNSHGKDCEYEHDHFVSISRDVRRKMEGRLT